MMQQINLYRPELKETTSVFSTATMLQFTLLFILLFTVIYGYQWYRIQPYQRQIDGTQTELAQLQQQVTALESAKSNKKSKLLENEIARVSQELDRKELIARILTSRSFGNEAGFSAYLESFARGHVDGTWLTNISIKAGGSLLGLTGKTLSSELVPLYIQKLAKEESLEGSAFNVLEIARAETKEGSTEINFTISTN